MMSRVWTARVLIRPSVMLMIAAVAVAGCAKSTTPGPGGGSSKPTAGAASRSQRVLDYFLNNKKVEWARVSAHEEGNTAVSPQDYAAFTRIIQQGRPVPNTVRALIEQGIRMYADVQPTKSTLPLSEAQEAIGKEDESSLGTIVTAAQGPGKFLQGTFYRYGAVQVGVDQAGIVQGLRIDLAHFND